MTSLDNIKVLLQSDDIMNVHMGFELLDSLVTEPEQILQALGIETEISSVDDLKVILKEFEHKGTILVYVLGTWAKLGVKWVLEIEELNLEMNMTELHPNIGLLTNLLSLTLLFNPLTSLPEQIQTLTNLTTLDLRYNQLTSIPEQIQTFTNLTTLDIDGNQLTSIPEQIQGLTNLKKLILGGNQLTSIPEQIQRLTNLTTLDLTGNELIALPESIGNLTQLSTLRLSYNRLAALPESIGNLTQLMDLRVENNQLTSLPEGIGNLTRLTTLGLESNQLTSLPEGIGNLTQLSTLFLSYNRLTALPESIGNLTTSDLRLEDNPLEVWPHTFRTTDLYLDHHLWKKFHAQICQIKSLESLNFGTDISLENIDWSGLVNLKYLEIWSDISIHFSETVLTLQKLEYFNLESVQISKSERIHLQKLLPDCEISFCD